MVLKPIAINNLLTMWVISKMEINSRISVSISCESVSIILDYKIFLAIFDFIFNAIQNIFIFP